MKRIISSTKLLQGSAACAALLLASSNAGAQGFTTPQQAYIAPVTGGDYTYRGLITAGEFVPRTGGGVNDNYQLVGIPDGMGLVGEGANLALYCNHEFANGQTSIPGKNGVLNPANGTLSGTGHERAHIPRRVRLEVSPQSHNWRGDLGRAGVLEGLPG
jgi:hypothetical protein